MSLITEFEDVKTKVTRANNLCKLILDNIRFTQLEYIQSTGTQYIDLDFTPNTNTTFEITYMLTSTANSQGLVSAYSTWTDGSYLLYTYSGVNWTYGGKRTAAPANTTTKYTLNIYRGRIIRNGSTITDVTSGTFANVNTTIRLFAKAGTPSNYAQYKLYSFKIWDNGTLVRDIIPILDIDNEPCLYDELTGKYYYNKGTGTFTAGPSI